MIALQPQTASTLPREHYLNQEYGIKSWLLTTDHKRIALLYLVSVTLFFFLGGIYATLIRLELLTPNGRFVSDENYNKLFTMHGLIMIFFFLIPSIPAVLGNFLLPMMIGARDLAFPRINLASWYIFMLGGLFTITAAVTGGVDTGWTFYTPYSSTYSNTARHHGGDGRVHHRVLVDLHRPEFHRHDAQDARAGADLVPLAAVRLGASTRRASSWCSGRPCWRSRSV